MLGLKRNELIMVAVMLSGTLLAVLNMTFLSPALPTIMADLGVSQTTAQWLTSGYSLTEAVIIPLSAFIMSRLSTRKMFLGGVGLFACGSLLAALAPNFGCLLAGRVMQAICTGMIMPMVFTVILLVIPREKRGSAMGVIGLVIGFAPAIGPSLSGLLVDSVGWRVLFGIVTALSVVVIVLGVMFLKNYGEFKRVKLDPLSPALSTVGLLCLLYGFSTFSSTDNLLLTVALIVVGAIVLALFVRRQLTLKEPMLRIDILKTRKYATAVAVIACVQMALIGTEVVTPLFVQTVRGYGATTSGLIMLPGAVIGALVGFFAGRLFDRFGVRKLALPGAVVMVLGAFGMASLGIETPVIVICLTFTTLSIGLQFIMTPLNTWGVNSLDNSVIQHAQGVSNTINQIAGSFGTAVLVSLTALGGVVAPESQGAERVFAGIHLSYTATALLLCAAFALIVLLVRDKKKSAALDATSGKGGSSAVGDAAASKVSCDGLVAPEGFGSTVLTHLGSVSGASGSEQLALAGHMSEWRVSDVMNRDPHYVHQNALMGDVIRLMGACDTSGVPVVDDALTVVGFVSDGDVASYLGRNDAAVFDRAHNLYQMVEDPEVGASLGELFSLNVMDIATRRVISVDASQPLDKACEILAEKRIKKVPVVADGRLVGSLSRRNVMRTLSLTVDLVSK